MGQTSLPARHLSGHCVTSHVPTQRKAEPDWFPSTALFVCAGLLRGDSVSHGNGRAGAEGAADPHVVPESHLPAGLRPERPGPAESQVGAHRPIIFHVTVPGVIPSPKFPPCSVSRGERAGVLGMQSFAWVPVLAHGKGWKYEISVFAPLSRWEGGWRSYPHATVTVVRVACSGCWAWAGDARERQGICKTTSVVSEAGGDS